jgi:hypothetical protein
MLNFTMNAIVSPGEGSLLLTHPVRVLGFRDHQVVVIELSLNPRKPWLIDKQSLVDEINCGASILNVEWRAAVQFNIQASSSETISVGSH